jgi:hypothetical protein
MPELRGNSESGWAVWGSSNSGTGVVGTAGGYGTGTYGESISSNGVFGKSTDGYGVLGKSTRGTAVNGESISGNGVFGKSTDGYGVSAHSMKLAGIIGEGVEGPGVRGYSLGTAIVSPPGVDGEAPNGHGVRGRSDTYIGVLGHSKTSTGVHGSSDGIDGIGVVGLGNPGKAAYFGGDVEVRGNLTVANGNKPFKIDHPLEPQNKYLLHHSVESSERKNVYDGVAYLDADGSAWVELPQWFEALNGDFRYQLTPIGAAAPELHVAEEVSENRFKIAGGQGRMKVCWQLTGTRKDAWAAANPFEVEQEKPQKERGRYLQPDLYDAPAEQRVMLVPEEIERQREVMRQEEAPPPPQAPELPQGPVQPQPMPLGSEAPGFGRLEEENRRQIEELREQIEELRQRL